MDLSLVLRRFSSIQPSLPAWYGLEGSRSSSLLVLDRAITAGCAVSKSPILPATQSLASLGRLELAAMMTSSSTDNASPSSSRPQLRAYDSFLSSSSPKAQALFVAPLNRFRRKTTDLVGQITGAQVKEEVLSDERRRREERRRAKCRACKVEFAGERELSKVSLDRRSSQVHIC